MNREKLSRTKPQKLHHLAVCIFALESGKGHLKWKVTDLVRKSGISRTLVYRYLGNSKKEILTSALNIFCSDFYGFADESRNNFPIEIARAREHLIKYPEAILFYQKWRSRESFLKVEFEQIERRFQKKLKSIFPHYSESEILLAHACIHGAVTSPFLSGDQAECIGRDLQRKGIL